jgi:hypothetical protein
MMAVRGGVQPLAGAEKAGEVVLPGCGHGGFADGRMMAIYTLRRGSGEIDGRFAVWDGFCIRQQQVWFGGGG